MNKIIKRMSYVLTILIVFPSCMDEHKETVKSYLPEITQNSELFMNENLNYVLDDYIEHLSNQDNKEIHNQLVMICASMKGSDTLISLSTSKYLGQFSIESNIEWRYKGKVGNREIFIGDQEPYLLENYYKKRNLSPYFISNELIPNYQDYAFPNSHWEFKLRGNKLE